MNKARMITLLSTWLLIACLPDPLAIDAVPRLAPRIVISTQVLPDQSVLVLVTKSFGALDASNDSDPRALLNQIAVNNAMVTIEDATIVDTLAMIGPGLYSSNPIKFQAEREFTLRVESPPYGSVSAVTQVKAPAVFTALEARIYDTGFDTLATIAYSFQDLIGKNYYMINVEKTSANGSTVSGEFLNPNVFTKLLEDMAQSDGIVVKDTFNVLFQDDFMPGDTLLVQLANISRGYYDFLQLRQDARFNFSDFLGEPVNYPSNVADGLGWFTLQIPDTRFIIIAE